MVRQARPKGVTRHEVRDPSTRSGRPQPGTVGKSPANSAFPGRLVVHRPVVRSGPGETGSRRERAASQRSRAAGLASRARARRTAAPARRRDAAQPDAHPAGAAGGALPDAGARALLDLYALETPARRARDVARDTSGAGRSQLAARARAHAAAGGRRTALARDGAQRLARDAALALRAGPARSGRDPPRRDVDRRGRGRRSTTSAARPGRTAG